MDEGKGHIIEEMCKAWPFFSTRVGMLEMVFSKTDIWLSEQYDHNLVKKELWYLGENLRNQLNADIKTVLSLSHKDELMADLPWIADSIALRNVYTDPLNLLQVELLRRFRESPENPSPDVEQALMITITGIAAGMRNTG
jgi:phosphoenolpyruvate carboxylase